MKIHPYMRIKQLFAIAAVSMLSLTASAQCLTPGTISVTEIESTSVTATWTASPSAPTGLEYNWEVRTSGDAGSGATGLEVSGATTNAILTTTINDNDLVFSTNYIFYVRYKCAEDINSEWIASAPFTTLGLETPETTPATSVFDVSFRANWNGVAGADGYILDVATTSNFATGTFVAGFENYATTATFENITGLEPNTQYFYRVRAQGVGGSGYYITPFSNVTSRSTLGPQADWITWNGSNWEPETNDGGPDEFTDAIINGLYDTAVHGSFSARNLTINLGYSLLIGGTTYVEVVNSVNNNNLDDTSLVIESNSYLVQRHGGANGNSGRAQVQRESAPIYRLDYTMWSSPTADEDPVTGGQTLQDFSPLTAANRFYAYDSTNDVFAEISRTEQFRAGKGYLIRARNNHPAFVSPATPGTTWTGTFSGVPFSGDLVVPLNLQGQRFNMVGNPYPSLISSDMFLEQNLSIEGTLYFWRRRNNDTPTTEATTAYYATYTTMGGVGVNFDENDPTAEGTQPTGYIQPGQGFLVQALSTVPATATIQFNNEMRSADNPFTPFFRNANISDRSRIWLNVSDDSKTYNQTLVGYANGGSNDLDRADGKYINDGTVALTSNINNAEYVIQGRAPFNASDVVALNFKTPVAGSYTISIDHVDGLFTGNQPIYLKDNTTQTLQNLKDGAYTFATAAGNFANRFELVYTNALSVGDAELNPESIVVFKQNGDININAGMTTIASVKVFDIRGSLIAQKSNVNASETAINAGTTKQVLIVQITSSDNKIVSKKIVN